MVKGAERTTNKRLKPGNSISFVPEGGHRTWHKNGLYEVLEIIDDQAILTRLPHRDPPEQVVLTGKRRNGDLVVPSTTTVRGALEEIVVLRGVRIRNMS